MPANASTDSSESVDTSGFELIASFNDGETGFHWTASSITFRPGPMPSTALVNVPLQQLDDVAPTIAGVDTGPLQQIKGGAWGKIEAVSPDGDSTVLFIGQVKSRVPHLGEGPTGDQAAIELVDMRWLLAGKPLIGSFWMSGTEDVKFRHGWHLYVNPGGLPNAIYREVEGADELVPVFCPPGYGLGDGEGPEDPNAQSQVKATLWRPSMLITYIRFALSAEGKALAEESFPYYPEFPDNLEFAEGLGSTLAESPSDEKVLPEREWKNGRANEVLAWAIRSAGPFDLMFGPQVSENDDGSSEFINQVYIIRNRFSGEGVTLNRIASGDAADVLTDTKIVTDGSLVEDFSETFSKFAISGRLVFIERRINSNSADNDGDLQKAWSTADATAYKDYIQTRINAGDELADAIKKANRKYFNVGADYRINPTFDYQDGTVESEYDRCEVPRPVLPHLLSSYLEGTGETLEDKMRFRREVLFEYYDDGSAAWFLADLADNLTVSGDGTISVQGLREGMSVGTASAVGPTLKIEVTGSAPSATVTVTERKLRATVAIPADHRLEAYGSVGAGTDEVAGVDLSDTFSEEDTDLMSEDFDRLYYAVSDVYGLELRKDSWPVPESVNGATQAADRPGGDEADKFLRYDQEALKEHLKERAKDFGRVKRGGVLIMPGIQSVFKPGQAIKELANVGLGSTYPIRCVIGEVTISNAINNQTTQLKLQ